MQCFRCPRCKNASVVWDSRSSSFLCCNKQCAAWFDPPSSDEIGFAGDDVSLAITLGLILPDNVQNWLNRLRTSVYVGQS